MLGFVVALQKQKNNREFEMMCKYAYPYLLQYYVGELSEIDAEIAMIERELQNLDEYGEAPSRPSPPRPTHPIQEGSA